MPLGFERLNERTQRPNAAINFIKPDASQSASDQKIAADFLSRIAAQCYPVMRAHHISVMSLDEFPPNAEFLGRNFNAGECIQLVLKDKRGRWLSFKFVQMVMMHELAHCKQMNHSRFFWGVRNEYAKMMEGLWAEKYTGEGMWGRGVDLESGSVVSDRMPEDVQIPEHLCGGTYRRARGRKRKRGQEGDADGEKPKLSYAEKQQKRIARKFGKHGEGNALGEDDLVRGALESASGKRGTGKPRVANSKRGRELRANAALARFDAMKKQATLEQTPELEDDDGSETESGWSSDEDVDSSESIILRKKAGLIKDRNGIDMVKVCGDEGQENEDEGGRDEMDELRLFSGKPDDFPDQRPLPSKSQQNVEKDSWKKPIGDDSETESEAEEQVEAKPPMKSTAQQLPPAQKSTRPAVATLPQDSTPPVDDDPEAAAAAPEQACSSTVSGISTCPICSLENDPASPTCVACSHVLKTSLVKNHWRCASEACSGSRYINAGDVGRCGVCSGQKPALAGSSGGQGGDSRPMGLTRAEVLRWD